MDSENQEKTHYKILNGFRRALDDQNPFLLFNELHEYVKKIDEKISTSQIRESIGVLLDKDRIRRKKVAQRYLYYLSDLVKSSKKVNLDKFINPDKSK